MNVVVDLQNEFWSRAPNRAAPVRPPLRDPVQSYSEFLAAVARRDADAVIAHMSAERSRKLREYRRRPNFAGLFELWCEDYSYQREVIACVIDGDCAILETETCAESLASRVTMVRNDGRWRIRCEQRTGSRIRTVTARSSHAN